MAGSRIGLWLIGAKGGVATTAITGLANLARGRMEPVGLVTALDPFTRLDLVDFADIVVGGHDIRPGRLADEARRMWTESRAILPELLDGAADFFAETERRLRPGTVVAAGDKIRELADDSIAAIVETPRQAIDRVRADIEAFATAEQLRHVVVVNVASTEPPAALPIPRSFSELEPLLDDPRACPLPASSLYALAAFEAGASYINFTPSTGATPEALQEVARQRRIAHTGCDGKTGETLLKSVLAPMFAARHLEVMSWVGHNIFGNMDGKVLDDPRNKTAWDHIHVRGFLGTPMTMQFTWQGCDSILAAPLVLDLVRLIDRAQRSGEYGAVEWLACFFKSPLGVDEQEFAAQFAMLMAWATSHASAGDGTTARHHA